MRALLFFVFKHFVALSLSVSPSPAFERTPTLSSDLKYAAFTNIQAHQTESGPIPARLAHFRLEASSLRPRLAENASAAALLFGFFFLPFPSSPPPSPPSPPISLRTQGDFITRESSSALRNPPGGAPASPPGCPTARSERSSRSSAARQGAGSTRCQTLRRRQSPSGAFSSFWFAPFLRLLLLLPSLLLLRVLLSPLLRPLLLLLLLRFPLLPILLPPPGPRGRRGSHRASLRRFRERRERGVTEEREENERERARAPWQRGRRPDLHTMAFFGLP